MPGLEERVVVRSTTTRQSQAGSVAAVLVAFVAGAVAALLFVSTPVSATTHTDDGNQPTVITITPQPQNNGGSVTRYQEPRPVCATGNPYVDADVEQPARC